ncbi:hypothetical protein ACH674_00185, partial [Klebsiella pneumoniae]
GTVCVVGKIRDLILQLSKSSIYSTKPQSKHNHVINVMLYYIAAKCSSDYELMTNRVFRGVDWEF